MQNWYSSVKLMFIAPPPLARGKALSLVSRGLTAYRYGSTAVIISQLSVKGNRKCRERLLTFPALFWGSLTERS